MTVSSLLRIDEISTIFSISEKMSCSNDWFRIRVKDLAKSSLLSLRIVAGRLDGTRAFWLFNWYKRSFCTSTWVPGFNTNEFNKELLVKFLFFFFGLRDDLRYTKAYICKTILESINNFLRLCKFFALYSNYTRLSFALLL